MNKITPGSNGLPPVKEQYNDYEKSVLVATVAKHGLKTVADAYGLAWQDIISWKRYTRRISAGQRGTKIFRNHLVKSELIIQSALGGTITPDEIQARVGNVDKIYVRVDENKAYWVKGTENGAIDLW